MNPPSHSGITPRIKGRAACPQPAAPGAARTPRPTRPRGKPPWLATLGATAGALTSLAQAQVGPISLTNAHVAEGYFQFEIAAPAEWTCEAESSDTLAGPWQPLPGATAGQSVRVQLDRPQQYFRARHDTLYSVNLAGYVTLLLPSGYSAIANPFHQGGNTVAELLPSVPLVLFKFDAESQIHTANQFDFGVWARPGETLAPGEGAWVVWGGPEVLTVTFGGLVPDQSEYPALEGGWNLISPPVPGRSLLPNPLAGDRIARFDSSSGFVLHEFVDGKWTPPEPVVGLGEAFWYVRNLPNPNALPPAPAVFFNNHVPGASPPLDARLFDLCGCPMSGTNWLAQIYALASGRPENEFRPAGDPLPFREGVGAGYLDISSGAVRRLPGVSPGAEASVDVRVWDARDAATYEDSLMGRGFYGRSGPIRVRGTTPPSPPASLVGLTTFINLASATMPVVITTQPTAQNAFLGGSARFEVQVETRALPPPQPTYQWQKAVPFGDWLDLADATTPELIVHPVRWESAGDYRVVLGVVGNSFTCSGVKECALSESARLRVLDLPRLTGAAWNTTGGTFAFTLTAEPGYDYAVEVSTNLSTWAAYDTVTKLAGPKQFVEPGASGVNERYFRARVLNRAPPP